ncbi:MAG: hypothetical protein CVT63_01170 [Candidatus Anoxymicrobium japonicum]|uniref:Calcineurin-like phosphoesterase domain-containing protein n=1 Tax=Candidatus Anoxymicrobium japonicum TaxID=2013648 RepID=A0A2N3G7Z9_9ACTN|nr:MAG: hypothetical protein CVT63_01170 [Candidatus Anoxymicrobium japonicum]
MSLKILHTADVHLGAKFLSLGRKGEEMRTRLLEVFDDTVDLAIRERVNLFLIAGDLFDSDRVSTSLIDRVARGLQNLLDADIPVLVSPGTHDPYGEHSIWRADGLAAIENLTVFKSEEMLPVRFPELDCTVYGNANVKPFANRYPLADLRPCDDSRWRIGMLHASFEIPDVTDDTYVATSAHIEKCGMDYVALGHYHSLSDRSAGDVAAFYSGSPEMIKMRKGEFGHVLLVNFDRDATRAQPVKLGKCAYEELTIKAEDMGVAGLTSMIESLADPDKALHVFIEGVRRLDYPDIGKLIDSVSEMFFHVLLTDRSCAAPSSLQPDSYPEGSPARLYLEVLREKLIGASDAERDEIVDAMQVGLSMLADGDATCV